METATQYIVELVKSDGHRGARQMPDALPRPTFQGSLTNLHGTAPALSQMVGQSETLWIATMHVS